MTRLVVGGEEMKEFEEKKGRSYLWKREREEAESEQGKEGCVGFP